MPYGFWRKKNRNSKIWYTRIRYPDGSKRERSTGCTDITAARVARGRLEREAMAEADPARNEKKEYALGQCLADYIASRVRIGRASGTISMYETKSGHLVRLLGADMDVNSLTPEQVEAYVDWRKSEGSHTHTIFKELTSLYAALRHGRRRGFRGHVDDLKVEGFRANYVPRERYLTVEEFNALEAQFRPDRARHLRFLVLCGASLGEAERCERQHVDLIQGLLHLPGTKTDTRRRRIPFGKLPDLHRLLSAILDTLPRSQMRLFLPWSNIRRDLSTACKEIGIDSCSPNDLRRTFGTWLKNRGLDSAVIARLMGHSSTRMVDRVYGRINDDTLADALGRLDDVVFCGVSDDQDRTEPEAEPVVQSFDFRLIKTRDG